MGPCDVDIDLLMQLCFGCQSGIHTVQARVHSENHLEISWSFWNFVSGGADIVPSRSWLRLTSWLSFIWVGSFVTSVNASVSAGYTGTRESKIDIYQHYLTFMLELVCSGGDSALCAACDLDLGSNIIFFLCVCESLLCQSGRHARVNSEDCTFTFLECIFSIVHRSLDLRL